MSPRSLKAFILHFGRALESFKDHLTSSPRQPRMAASQSLDKMFGIIGTATAEIQKQDLTCLVSIGFVLFGGLFHLQETP